MNEKEVAEIRRRFNPQKTNIIGVHGCYVNENREIVAEFNQPLAALTQDETESMLALLKKLLSGGLDRNLIDIEFSNEQVLGGEEHKRLLKLRDSALCDEPELKALFSDIIETVRVEGAYLILAAADNYDVFTYREDGKKDEDSTELFKYFLCGVFPVKMTKPQLSFAAFDNTFKNIVANSVITAPLVIPRNVRQHELIHKLFYKGRFTRAYRTHNADINISAGTRGNILVDAHVCHNFSSICF